MSIGKRYFLIICLALLFPKALFGYSLLITEVQISGESPDNDYIKIYNSEQFNLDLSGYRLKKKSSTGKEYSIRVFPKETVILKQGYLIWANSRNDFHLEAKADIFSSATISKNNSIALFDNMGNIIDTVGWGNEEGQFQKGSIFPDNPDKGQVLKRIQTENIFQNTNNNSADFYLDPPILKEEVITYVDPPTKEKIPQNTNKNILATITALLSGTIIIFLKKNLYVRT